MGSYITLDSSRVWPAVNTLVGYCLGKDDAMPDQQNQQNQEGQEDQLKLPPPLLSDEVMIQRLLKDYPKLTREQVESLLKDMGAL